MIVKIKKASKLIQNKMTSETGLLIKPTRKLNIWKVKQMSHPKLALLLQIYDCLTFCAAKYNMNHTH